MPQLFLFLLCSAFHSFMHHTLGNFDIDLRMFLTVIQLTLLFHQITYGKVCGFGCSSLFQLQEVIFCDNTCLNMVTYCYWLMYCCLQERFFWLNQSLETHVEHTFKMFLLSVDVPVVW